MSDLVKRLVNLHLYELANDVGDLEAELVEALEDSALLDWADANIVEFLDAIGDWNEGGFKDKRKIRQVINDAIDAEEE